MGKRKLPFLSKKTVIMPQVQLPIFPEDVLYINSSIAVQTKGDNVFYFNGMMAIYHYGKDDYKSFRYEPDGSFGKCKTSGNNKSIWGKQRKRETMGESMPQPRGRQRQIRSAGWKRPQKKVAPPKFTTEKDVEKAGFLLALPALIECGLLSFLENFKFDEKYYSLSSILLTLTLCFLLRKCNENAYFGKKNKLPRKFMTRLRLALWATTDHWANDRIGRPFFQ